jgi:hypothetical protein
MRRLRGCRVASVRPCSFASDPAGCGLGEPICNIFADVTKFPLSVAMLTQVCGHSLQILPRKLTQIIHLQTLFYVTYKNLTKMKN